MHDNMPIFIGFYHRTDLPHAPYQKLPMPVPPQIKARQQLLELRPTDSNRIALHFARQEEAIATFQPLTPQTKSVAVPVNDFDPVTPGIAEGIQRRLEDIPLQCLLDDQPQVAACFLISTAVTQT
jgi:hypothetical protein